MNPPFFHASPAARVFILGSLFIFILALIPELGSHSDIGYWQHWSCHSFTHGLYHIYFSSTDYPPLYHYVLFVYGKLQGSKEEIIRYIGLLKAFTFLFDLGGLWLVYRWIDRKVDLLFLILVSVFNLGFIYNTLFWGQVDAIQGFLLFFAMYAAWQKKTVMSFMMMILAINFKLQAIILVPVWGLILLNNLVTEKNIRSLFLGILAGIVTQILILLPFVQLEGSFDRLLKVVFGAVGRYTVLSANAFNFWYYMAADPPAGVDTDPFIGSVTARQFGVAAFCLSSSLAMLPHLMVIWKNLRNRTRRDLPRESIWLSSALIVMLFFFLNTEMHERYVHTALLFIIAFSFYRKQYFVLAVFSLAYFLNLEAVLKGLKFRNYGTLIFEPKLIAGLFAICIGYLFYQLYRSPGWTGEHPETQPARSST